MSATVIVFDDRVRAHEPFLDLNYRLNSLHCARQGLNFEFVGGPDWPELRRMPPHWARVDHMSELASLEVKDANSFLISMDSDAAFANPGFPLKELLGGLSHDKSVFLAKDPNMWRPPAECEAGVYCSGFVLVRLDAYGRRFLKEWRDAYDPSQWWQDELGRWSSDGNWAGSTYEQGQLNRLAHGHLQHLVQELPQALFNSPFAREVGEVQPVIVHLMRRPGELQTEKPLRVATTFRMLLEASMAHFASRRCPDDGIPRSAEGLSRWEEIEESWWPHQDLWR